MRLRTSGSDHARVEYYFDLSVHAWASNCLHKRVAFMVFFHFLRIYVGLFNWHVDSFERGNLINIRDGSKLLGERHEVLLLVRPDLLGGAGANVVFNSPEIVCSVQFDSLDEAQVFNLVPSSSALSLSSSFSVDGVLTLRLLTVLSSESHHPRYVTRSVPLSLSSFLHVLQSVVVAHAYNLYIIRQIILERVLLLLDERCKIGALIFSGYHLGSLVTLTGIISVLSVCCGGRLLLIVGVYVRISLSLHIVLSLKTVANIINNL